MPRNSAVLDTPKFGAPSATTLRHIDRVKKRISSKQPSTISIYECARFKAELHVQFLNRVDEIQNGEGE